MSDIMCWCISSCKCISHFVMCMLLCPNESLCVIMSCCCHHSCHRVCHCDILLSSCVSLGPIIATICVTVSCRIADTVNACVLSCVSLGPIVVTIIVSCPVVVSMYVNVSCSNHVCIMTYCCHYVCHHVLLLSSDHICYHVMSPDYICYYVLSPDYICHHDLLLSLYLSPYPVAVTKFVTMSCCCHQVCHRVLL